MHWFLQWMQWFGLELGLKNPLETPIRALKISFLTSTSLVKKLPYKLKKILPL